MKPRCVLGYVRWVVLLLVVLFAGARLASAEEYAEIELRLKSAGVSAPMRKDIHAAIQKGAAALLRHLADRRTGSNWPARIRPPIRKRPRQLEMSNWVGHQVLGALALRHTGTPENTAHAQRIADQLIQNHFDVLSGSTYEAGLASMLLQALHAEGRDGKRLHRIHDALSRGVTTRNGYWGYKARGGTRGAGNLSTAQFGALGLWAAERGGAKTAEDCWLVHLQALLAAQDARGSWGYHRGSVGWRYVNGTFMGVANLALARAALKDALVSRPALDADVHVARYKAKAALRRDAQWALASVYGLNAAHVHWNYYGLYALEKACVFLGTDSVGGVPWYIEGARWLLRRQLPTGGWSQTDVPLPGGAVVVTRQSSIVSTAFALLFLLRASATYRPVTPRPITPQPPKPKRVTTPSASDEPASGGTPTGHTAPPPSLLMAVLEQFQKVQGAQRPKAWREITQLIERALYLYRKSRVDAGFASDAHDKLASLMEKAILDLANSEDTAIALTALDALRSLHPRIATALMRSVDTHAADRSASGSHGFVWVSTACEVLRTLRPQHALSWLQIVSWLESHALREDGATHHRATAALVALGGVAESLPGAQRRGMAQRLLDSFTRGAGGSAYARSERRIGRAVLFYRLATASSRTDAPDFVGLVDPKFVTSLRSWWEAHGAATGPHWK